VFKDQANKGYSTTTTQAGVGIGEAEERELALAFRNGNGFKKNLVLQYGIQKRLVLNFPIVSN